MPRPNLHITAHALQQHSMRASTHSIEKSIKMLRDGIQEGTFRSRKYLVEHGFDIPKDTSASFLMYFDHYKNGYMVMVVKGDAVVTILTDAPTLRFKGRKAR